LGEFFLLIFWGGGGGPPLKSWGGKRGPTPPTFNFSAFKLYLFPPQGGTEPVRGGDLLFLGARGGKKKGGVGPGCFFVHYFPARKVWGKTGGFKGRLGPRKKS